MIAADARRQLVGAVERSRDRRGELLDEERVSFGRLGDRGSPLRDGPLRRGAAPRAPGSTPSVSGIERQGRVGREAAAPAWPRRRGARGARARRTGPARRARATRASRAGRAGSSRPSGCPRTGASSGRAARATRRTRAPRRRASRDRRPLSASPTAEEHFELRACSSAAAGPASGATARELCPRLGGVVAVEDRRGLLHLLGERAVGAARPVRRRAAAKDTCPLVCDELGELEGDPRLSDPGRPEHGDEWPRPSSVTRSQTPVSTPSSRSRPDHAEPARRALADAGIGRTREPGATGALLPFASTGWAGRYSITSRVADVRLLTDDDRSGRRRRLETRRGVDDVPGDHRLAVSRAARRARRSPRPCSPRSAPASSSSSAQSRTANAARTARSGSSPYATARRRRP